MIKITVLCLAIVFSQSAVWAATQGANVNAVKLKLEKLSSKMDRAVRDRRGGWLLERKLVDESRALSEWTADKKRMSASIHHYPSVEAAIKDMSIAPGIVSRGYGEKLDGLGEEAYVWKWDDGGTRYRVQFRKSNLIIIIHASTIPDGEDLARVLADTVTVP
ncbi:MAG TPA: hypothetical protein VJ302_04425 [Blastocatellia bacterium]|nr:hypothetical protein [Blastocatellia bacterium]